MKNFLLILALLIFAGKVFALDIVYPKTQNPIINSVSTFFIGSADPDLPLTINQNKVEVHPSGGFAYPVPLNFGINTFEIKSGKNTLIYNITRPKNQVSNTQNNIFNEFSTLKYAIINSDNAPLRSTPIDGGINRLSHLQNGIQLVIDGERNGFYRVILGTDNFGWISKKHIDVVNTGLSLAEYFGYEDESNDEFYQYIFHFDHPIPFEIIESNPMIIKFYNISGFDNNTYKYEIPINQALIGYYGEFIGNDFVFKIRKPLKINPKKPLKNLKIVIDAGHGGSEFGAIGCLGDKEKDLMLDYAKNLADELKSRGAEVVLTRDKDLHLGLYERVDIANNNNSVLFISLHANALPDNLDPTKVYGTEIYYYYDEARTLADEIMQRMITNPEVRNNGIKQASFAVVRNTQALSLLIEVGYLINPRENSLILTKKFKKFTSKSIADGIENFVLKNFDIN